MPRSCRRRRARRGGNQDRRRRHGRRLVEPVSQPERASPLRPASRTETRSRRPQGDRRQRLPGAGARQERATRPSTRPSHTGRTSRGSPPATRGRAHRPAATTRHRRTCPASRRSAWIGNYRVFTVPTPLGHQANTPEIVDAFEAAVADGMNVINFSGGGPETDPANDAMYETMRNTALAGVVPVIAAGNDREDFGLGSDRLAGDGSRRDLGRSDVELTRLRPGAHRDGRAAVTRRRSRSRAREAAKLPGAWSTARPAARRRLERRSAATASPSTRICAAPRAIRTAASARSSKDSLAGQGRPRLTRHLHVRLEGGARGDRRRERASS